MTKDAALKLIDMQIDGAMEQVKRVSGTQPITPEEWQALWDTFPLHKANIDQLFCARGWVQAID